MAEWISAKKMLPQKGRDVFIILDLGSRRIVWIGRRGDGGWDVLGFPDWGYDPDHRDWNCFKALAAGSGWSVTHWLPMPEARKEDNYGD